MLGHAGVMRTGVQTRQIFDAHNGPLFIAVNDLGDNRPVFLTMAGVDRFLQNGAGKFRTAHLEPEIVCERKRVA